MKIPGFPYQKITIESSLDVEKFQKMLRINTISKQPWFKNISDDYEFIGKITNNSFKLIPAIKGRNTYSPWIIGNYKPRIGGCSVNIIFTIHPVAVILMFFFFIFPQYLFISSTGSFNIIYALAIIVLHFILYYIGFLPETKRIAEFIKNATE